ncbi:galactose mutarotase [Nostocoides sp. F2B08]|uniref:aldose 1-epimerase family protein n=1 Tax=Nostocoides sp. F2B08 TaxID=2653936 RepID=UPI001262C814|nr:aldose 1-epimerase family protein [Tetrasphaera sp. F2B08]KAB7745239.1 galactose mutarotase [Tetrasphaera sp. F2B08]
MTTPPRSGTQYLLTAGGYEATIASVGATLRRLVHVGRDLIVPFDSDAVRPAYRGALLAPWPNRIVDGNYAFAGVERQVALTEPERGHALHGLAAWLDFGAVGREPDRVTVAATIVPQQGYPWRVRVETTFALGADGLSQIVRATNECAEVAPFGTGSHPYLVAGAGPLDDWTLSLPASRVIGVAEERLSPSGLGPVEVDAHRFDFRVPRRLGPVQIDHAFTDLHRDASGTAAVRLTDPAGTGVEVSWGSTCPWVQIHTADLPAGPSGPGHRIGLAVEPMTCAPDAFNSSRYDYDTGLLTIEPGQTITASWRIAAL